MSSKLKSDKQTLVLQCSPGLTKIEKSWRGGGGGEKHLFQILVIGRGEGKRNLMVFESREAACYINPFTLRGLPGKKIFSRSKWPFLLVT